MTDTISIVDLFDYHKDRLDLKWIAGEKGKNNKLDKKQNDGKYASPMQIGHMNFVHPHRIQVIGPTELEYIQEKKKSGLKELLIKIYQNNPIAILITNDLTIPQEIIDNAEKTATPLMSSSIDDQEVINHIAYFLNSVLAEKTTVHGVFMAVAGIGVLLTGKSGIGKSELALELLSRGHRLIADDAPQFSRTGPDSLVGTCPPALQDFLEVRGLGVLSIRSIFGDSAVKKRKNLRLVVELKPVSEIDYATLDRLKSHSEPTNLLGVKIPKVILPVAPGRNLAVIIESAARNQILLDKGYDATAVFINRQKELLERTTP
ncbi:MAG: HPr(Ser) kinase/phosphatase [Gammaproteobacteria bacterium]|nr:HPr(Ser) kinase/phosphatase [Gammaproteobacteria bacterium]